ncbi:MAG TPA: DUF4388 domain-containing protein [Methylomirabilota bacterium]|nr:DUF4388 domain-containing protein [Methylomirabilota bacterium]
MNSQSPVENIFSMTGNTAFIRPLRNGLLNGQIRETSLIRKPLPVPSYKTTQTPISWPNLDQMPVATLLKILGDSRKSATLKIYSQPFLGMIYLRSGKICFASITSLLAPISPYKAFHRILTWKTGTLKLEWGDSPVQSDEICEEVSPLLRENASRAEEVRALQNQFPPQAHLKVDSLPQNIKNLAPPELDVLQMAMEGKTVQEVLDIHPFSDLEIYRLLLGLCNNCFVSCTGAPAVTEQTLTSSI